MLVPEGVELVVERLDLLDDFGITALREPVPELCPALADLVDLCVDGRDDDVILRPTLDPTWTFPSVGTTQQKRNDCEAPAAKAIQRTIVSATSLVAELGEAVLVEAEVVAELVENGDPDLALELVRVGELLLERQPEDRDPVGQRRLPCRRAPAAGCPRRGRRGRDRPGARPRPRRRRCRAPPRGAAAASRAPP